MKTRPTASVLVTYGRKKTVWKNSFIGLIELIPTEIRSAIAVESGTVITTRMNVFFNACRK